jgi:hypothetical protein
VVANDVAVLPGDGDAFRARLEQGIVDTIAEDLVLNGAAAPVPAEPASANASVIALANTSALFAAAGPELSVLFVRGADDAAYKGMALPPDVRARIDASLASGHGVVLPRQLAQVANAAESRVAWYRVDLADGSSIGVADNGYHTATADRAITEARVAEVFGNPYVRMQHVAEASQEEVYHWFASRFGHSPDLMRACMQLREACINALAVL